MRWCRRTAPSPGLALMWRRRSRPRSDLAIDEHIVVIPRDIDFGVVGHGNDPDDAQRGMMGVRIRATWIGRSLRRPIPAHPFCKLRSRLACEHLGGDRGQAIRVRDPSRSSAKSTPRRCPAAPAPARARPGSSATSPVPRAAPATGPAPAPRSSSARCRPAATRDQAAEDR